MAALRARILDVVMDQAEVVAHLHGGRTRQRPLVLARDRLVGQQAQQRPQPLAAARPASRPRWNRTQPYSSVVRSSSAAAMTRAISVSVSAMRTSRSVVVSTET